MVWYWYCGNIVKVLPLHEIERAATVEMIRYGYPFVRVRWVFDFAVRFANRTSDPCGGVLDGIVKRPEEIAVCADAVGGLNRNSSRCNGFLSVALFFMTQEEPGVRERGQEECVQREFFLRIVFFVVLRFLLHFLAP